MWPDVRLKRGPIFPKAEQKVPTLVSYFKCDVIKIAQKVIEWALRLLRKKMYCQDLSKIASSGHTAPKHSIVGRIAEKWICSISRQHPGPLKSMSGHTKVKIYGVWGRYIFWEFCGWGWRNQDSLKILLTELHVLTVDGISYWTIEWIDQLWVDQKLFTTTQTPLIKTMHLVNPLDGVVIPWPKLRLTHMN